MKEVILNDRTIRVHHYNEEIEEGLYRICIEFKVTSDEYHELTTLLYKGTFDIKIPEKNVMFRGNIQQYSTSITNLYEKGKVADFKLCLREVKNLTGS